MRSRFFPQIQVGTVSIDKVEFDTSSRHELIPVLMALQYLYVHCKDVIENILALISKDVCTSKNPQKGCKGLTLWENLVLMSLRLGCNYNYDHLADTASHHRLVRQVLGVSDWDNKAYKRSTIHENISKLSPKTINAISEMIISVGHKFSNDPLKRVRGDTFVLKKNIHYPTDSNLIYDGIRKTIDISAKIADNFNLPGWRQHEYLKRKAKRTLRSIIRIARGRKKDRKDRLKAAYQVLLNEADAIVQRAVSTIHTVSEQVEDIPVYWKNYISELQYFIGGVEYVCELADRRIIKEEEIPNSDKVFSHFEPGTELINRGKSPNPIEFGHRVLIIQDNSGFIIHSSVLDIGFTDEKIIVDVMKKLQDRYNRAIHAASFDKGFWTPNNLKELSEFIPLVVLPKKGRRSKADSEREGAKEFGTVRKWHSGVESAINALGAGNGMKVCRDRGCIAYERYVAMAILGRNLHTLGRILIEKDRKRRKKDPLAMLVG